MTRIAILTPTLTSADAVSNDVLAMQRLLSDRGHDAWIFADSWNLNDISVQHSDATESFLKDPDDVLIYHHSIGWDRGIRIVEATCARKVIKYHNITPPEFFDGVSPQHSTLCKKGRDQLRALVDCEPDLYLAASAYNITDLMAAGSPARNTLVVPPFNNGDKLQASAANLEIVDSFNDGSINLLAVGGVRPNKGHMALIEAFATYYYHFNAQARLFIVGALNQAFESYTTMLEELIDFFGLDSRIVFTGEVSDDSLKSYYLLSHAFLVTSEHEGFCVPLVEAMAMRLPIVAYDSTAIPETAENAAIIWHERDPLLMAQSVDYLVNNEVASVALTTRGWERYDEHFSNQAIEKQFLKVTSETGFHF